MSENKTILLVIDNSIVAKDLKNMLTHGGYDVLIYSRKSGREIKSSLKKFPILVIIDISEGMLGESLELVDEIRKIRYCPVIYLVLEPDAGFINQYIKPKLDGYIVKPISRQHLLDAVHRVIEINRQYRDTQN